MADKNIKIGIKTTADTSGAKAAEAALNDVAKAGEKAAQEPQGFGRDPGVAKRVAARDAADALEAQGAAMIKATQATNDLEKGLGQISEGLKEVAEAGEEANEQGGNLEKNVKEITRAQKAQALSQLAQAVGQIGGKFKEAAAEIREFDEDAAKTFEETGERVQKVTGAVSQLALGFAIGGPVGAGVAALAIGVGALVDVFMEAEVAAAKANAVRLKGLNDELAALKASRAAYTELSAEMERTGIEDTLRRQNEALAEGVELLREQVSESRNRRKEQEEIAKAEDKLRLARIEEDEATGKITPEEARKQRGAVERGATGRQRDERKTSAAEEAALAREIADRQIDSLTKAEQSRAEADQKLRDAEDDLLAAMKRGDPQEDIAKREADRQAAQEDFAKKDTAFQNQYSTTSDAVNAAARAAREKDSTISTVDTVAAREEEARAAQERARNARDVRGVAGDAAGVIEGEPGSRAKRNVEEATAKLKDGGTAAELVQLGEALTEFAATAEGVGQKDKSQLKTLTQTVRGLSERLRRLEGK